MYKIIDAHTHIYPEAIADKAAENLGHFYNFPIYGGGTEKDIEETAVNAGVSGFIFLAVATNAHQVQKVNDTMAEAVKHSVSCGFETYGFGGMHQDFENFEGEAERIISLGLRGIKIHPDIQRFDLDSVKMYELCEIIEGRMPLFLHMGDDREEYRYSEPKKLSKLLDKFPKLEVVAAHLGGYKAWDEAKCLHGRPNVWYDNSSALWALTPKQAEDITESCGFDRVMFGTDYPVYTLAEYLKLFMKLDFSEKQREDIFYNNAKRFLGK